MDPVHKLVHTDRGDDAGDHHYAEDKGEHGVSQLPLIGHQSICNQRRKINSQNSRADSDNQRVNETGGWVERFAVEYFEVIHEVGGGDQGYRLLLNLKGAARRVYEHDHKWENAQNCQKDTDNIDQCANDRVAVSSFK